MRLSILYLVVASVLFPAAAKAQTPPADNKAPEIKKNRSAEAVDGKVMIDWMKDLKESKDPGVKVRAIHALKFYREDAREAVPLIMKALTDADTSLRVNAVIALGFIGFDAKDREQGINSLIRLLTEKQDIVRFQAARALGRLGPDSAPALPTLVNAIRDRSSSEIRMASAFAMGSAGWDSLKGPDRRAIYALLGALNDVCQDVRMEALFSLIVLGPPVRADDKAAEKQALQALTRDKSKKVVIWAHVAIMRLDKVSEQHLAPIAKFLKDPDMHTRINAARAFAIMGKDAKSKVKPDLIYALDDKEPAVVIWVCIALGEMRDAAQEAVPKLEELKDHADEGVKRAAAEALGQIKAKVRN